MTHHGNQQVLDLHSLRLAICEMYVACVHTCLPLQSLPDGFPQLVPPSLERLDYSQLQKDIPKYETKCGLAHSAVQWWEMFLVQIADKCNNDDTTFLPEWTLMVLAEKTVCGRARQQVRVEQICSELPTHIIHTTKSTDTPCPQVL